ncbi:MULTISPECIES: hypothetical protein [Caballeronia]|uniref:hypothetical protein n=1 Tax=Caballeronia TaxID=1827195 RepID=UPI001FD04112|nr:MULTISPECIES: hypothetical protein [Caballeronia]MDR5799079.1 hypothetical protein [Caballeronia sp. LZ001]
MNTKTALKEYKWTKEDSAVADAGGWGLFESLGNSLELQLQRCDEAAVFENDEAVATHVQTMADRGDPVAIRAIQALVAAGSSDVVRFGLKVPDGEKCIKSVFQPQAQEQPVEKPMMLTPSGRFITDDRGRKIAEMFQPGDSPAEQEAIKRRLVGSFNALPSIVGVLIRADKEGTLTRALYNEGITDAYDEALGQAVQALGAEGIAMVAHRYELEPEVIHAKAAGSVAPIATVSEQSQKQQHAPDAHTSGSTTDLMALDDHVLIGELRRRGIVLSAWGLADVTSTIENDGATDALTDEQFAQLEEKLFESAAKSLEDLLTNRGNQHIADTWEINRTQLIGEVCGSQASPTA